jgi:acyl carrier protein
MNDSNKPELEQTGIEQRIARIIAEKAQIDAALLQSSSTMNDFEIPSIAQLEILFAIEEEFDVYLPDDEASQSGSKETLSDLALTVQQLIAEKTG